MKNALLILNILLLLAVGYLFMDKFGSSSETPAQDEQNAVETASAIKIAFVNIDTLQAKSSDFQAKRAELEKRQADAEKALETRGKAFQRELAAYQKKIQSGNITPKEAQETEARLARKEQEFNAEQERLSRELLQETDAFNSAFTKRVKEHLENLKAELGYDAIIMTGLGSPVLVYSPEFDITDKVLDLVNKEEK
ncbi:MAG: hypothetical protein Kow0027_26390 [Saprospiraceae bacterium]